MLWLIADFGLLALASLALATWIALSVADDLWRRVRSPVSPQTPARWFSRARLLGRSYLGMQLAHLGVAVFVIGVAVVNSAEIEKDTAVNINESVQVGQYRFRLDRVGEVSGQNYQALRADVSVFTGDELQTVMHPEKRVYHAQRMPMTEAAIDSGLIGDVYVSLGDRISENTWLIRVYLKPFVNWIWIGCLMMAVGGGLAVSDRRYRLVFQRRSAARDDSPGHLSEVEGV